MSDERRQPRKHMGLQCLGMDEITEKKKVRSAIFQFSDAEKEAWMSCKESGLDCIVPGELVMTGTSRKGAKTYLHMVPDQPFGPPEICYSAEETDTAGL